MGLGSTLKDWGVFSSSSGTSSASTSKQNPNKQVLGGRWKKDIQKYVTDERVKKLKHVELNDKEIRQEDMEKLFLDISHKTRKAPTPEAIERYLKYSYRNHLNIDWKNKKKIMAWARAEAKKEMANAPAPKKVESKLEIAKKLQRAEERSKRVSDARKVLEDQKFKSPKQNYLGGNRSVGASDLGIKNVSKEFKIGNNQNVASMGMNKHSAQEEKPRGLTPEGGVGLIGSAQGGSTLSGNNMNLNNRPRIGGM